MCWSRLYLALILLLLSMNSVGKEGITSLDDQDLIKPWYKHFFTPSAGVGFVTDYVWRGVSQNNLAPAVQPDFYLGTEWGFYGEVWSSHAYQQDNIGQLLHYEVDLIGGWKYEKNDFSFDASIVRYSYPNAVGSDYNEGIFKIAYKVFSAEVGYSNNVFANSEYGTYVAGALEIPVLERYTLHIKDVSVGGHVGHYFFAGPLNGPYAYTDYGAFLRKTFKYLDMEISWKDTNHGFQFPPYDRSEVVFSINVHSAA